MVNNSRPKTPKSLRFSPTAAEFFTTELSEPVKNSRAVREELGCAWRSLRQPAIRLAASQRIFPKDTVMSLARPAALAALLALPLSAVAAGVVYEGGDGPGKGKHIVLVSGDEEYRSEEALPQ